MLQLVHHSLPWITLCTTVHSQNIFLSQVFITEATTSQDTLIFLKLNTGELPQIKEDDKVHSEKLNWTKAVPEDI